MYFQIAVLRHTYQPDLQGEENPGIHNDNYGNPVEYETIDEAIEVIREMDADGYVTSNNESGRPTLLVVESVHGDYISGGRNGDGSNYDWDGWEDFCSHDGEDACGECNGCIRHMIEQDRKYLLNVAVYKS